MMAKQAVAHGQYKEAQGYLKSALRATRNPDVNKQQSFRGGEQDSSKRGTGPTPGGGADPRISTPTSSTDMPACRQTISYRMPEDFHVQLVSANLDDQENASPNGANQSNGNQSNPSQANPNQSNTDQNNANQDSVNPQANAEK